MTTRWLFGDQLGPHFADDHRGPLLMVESLAVFRRRRFHRAKAHLVLSAMRHRAAQLDRMSYVRAETYAEVVGPRSREEDDVEVVHPTSYAALGLAERLGATVLPPRDFATPREDFERWAEGRGGRRLLMEDFYRRARLAHGVLVDGGEPAGGQWNFDHDNRQPPPKGAETLTGRGASPRPGARRWRRSTTSSSTGCPTSARTRTPCSRATPGWRTASSAHP
jgi:deoxyribodipyrimidine photolyase-related protein